MASLVRFVHAAQARLDVPASGFYDSLSALPTSARVSLEDATLDAFDRLVEQTRELEADALLLVGNTVRAADRSLRARRRLEEGLARLDDAGIATVIAPGPLDPPATYKMLAMPDSAALLSPRDPRHSIRPTRSEIEFILGSPDQDQFESFEDSADVQIAVVPPDRDAELNAKLGEKAPRRFDPPHDIGRGPGVSYWALGSGLPTTMDVKSGLAHDPGPLSPPSANFSGPCGATLVEIESSGSVRTTAVECSPVRCETISLSLSDIKTVDALAELMLDRLAGMHFREELTVITWRLAGTGPISKQLANPSTWADVIGLADDEAGRSRVHLRHHEPAANGLDDVAAMLNDEFRDLIATTDPDPRDQIDVDSTSLNRLLTAAAETPRTSARIRELGATVFSADCDDLWKVA